MVILSHRGYWKTQRERNKEIAFRRSFENGFGAETDIRDIKGRLIISHDSPKGNEMSFQQFLEIYTDYGSPLTLALNIKSDGLQKPLKYLLKRYNVKNYFVFDMSIPDTLHYLKDSFKIFMRQSELEKNIVLYDGAAGIWMDCFFSEWFDEKTIEEHLKDGKKICLVSPELHKRDYLPFWKRLRSMEFNESGDLMICTDYPDRARKFFTRTA